MEGRPSYAVTVPVTVPVPASPVQRLVAGAIDVVLVVGVSAFLPIPVLMRVLCAVLVVVLLVVAQAFFGAGPGGAIMGLRLLRVSQRGGAPGSAAVGRAFLVAMASMASLGVAPVLMTARADATGLRRTWFDRISGTMLVSGRSHLMYTLVIGGRSVMVDTAVLLGRAPERGPGREHARLVSVPSDDATVSKTHALIEPTPEGVSVTDLGSTNGTFLVDANGSHELTPGMAEMVPRGGAIYFGEAECRVR